MLCRGGGGAEAAKRAALSGLTDQYGMPVDVVEGDFAVVECPGADGRRVIPLAGIFFVAAVDRLPLPGTAVAA